jgi:hypothetical protein
MIPRTVSVLVTGYDLTDFWKLTDYLQSYNWTALSGCVVLVLDSNIINAFHCHISACSTSLKRVKIFDEILIVKSSL